MRRTAYTERPYASVRIHRGRCLQLNALSCNVQPARYVTQFAVHKYLNSFTEYSIHIWSRLFSCCAASTFGAASHAFLFCSARRPCVCVCECNVASANVLRLFFLHMRTFTVQCTCTPYSHRQLVKRVLECWWAKVWKSHRHLCHASHAFYAVAQMHFQRNFDIFKFLFFLFISPSLPFDLNTHNPDPRTQMARDRANTNCFSHVCTCERLRSGVTICFICIYVVHGRPWVTHIFKCKFSSFFFLNLSELQLWNGMWNWAHKIDFFFGCI